MTVQDVITDRDVADQVDLTREDQEQGSEMTVGSRGSPVAALQPTEASPPTTVTREDSPEAELPVAAHTAAGAYWKISGQERMQVPVSPPPAAVSAPPSKEPQSRPDPKPLRIDINEGSGAGIKVEPALGGPPETPNGGCANNGTKASNSRPSTSHARKTVVSKKENDPAEEPPVDTVSFCQFVGAKLEAESGLASHQRWELVRNALDRILGDESPALWGLIGSLCRMLYQADQANYARWVRTMIEIGEVFVYGGLPHRVSRLMMIAKPHFIEELNLRSTAEILLLDTALGAYRAYVGLTQEVNSAHIMPGDPPSQEIASQRARTAATSQRLLETYIKTMAYLSSRRQLSRVVDVKVSDDESP